MCKFSNRGSFIGKDNKCIVNCTGQEGLYNKDIGNSIYKCSFSCLAQGFIFYLNGSMQCLDKCPTNKDYFVVEAAENNYECRENCPYDYPYYEKTEKNDIKKYCPCSNIFPCSDKQYFYNGE